MADARSNGNGDNPSIARLQHRIDEQAAEIEALRGRLAANQFAEALRRSLADAAVAGVIAAPITRPRLLEITVQTSMNVVAAEAAALFLVDEKARELIFEVALGPHAAAVKELRVPLGHGIAGLVAVTGQPIIIADADQDPRQASDIAQAAGYTPRSILCVPLLREDRVIGVLEMLDKHGQAGFGPADLEISALFATQAAIVIEQALTIHNISGLLAIAMQSYLDRDVEKAAAQNAEVFARHIEATPQFQQCLELAILVHQIVRAGEPEMQFAKNILGSIRDLLNARSASSVSGMPGWI